MQCSSNTTLGPSHHMNITERSPPPPFDPKDCQIPPVSSSRPNLSTHQQSIPEGLHDGAYLPFYFNILARNGALMYVISPKYLPRNIYISSSHTASTHWYRSYSTNDDMSDVSPFIRVSGTSPFGPYMSCEVRDLIKALKYRQSSQGHFGGFRHGNFYVPPLSLFNEWLTRSS